MDALSLNLPITYSDASPAAPRKALAPSPTMALPFRLCLAPLAPSVPLILLNFIFL